MKSLDYTDEGINLEVSYPQEEKLCIQHDTTPEEMEELFKAYNKQFVSCIQYYVLDEVELHITIDNWYNGGIDTEYPLKLSWSEQMMKPEGHVWIYLGYPDDKPENRLDPFWIQTLLGHELAHVLIFCYLTTFMKCELERRQTRFGNYGYFLPETCKIPKIYIELLCDSIALAQSQTQEKMYRSTWDREEYYAKDPEWAVNFIVSKSQEIVNQLTKKTQSFSRGESWSKILSQLLRSPDAKIWIKDSKDRLD